ncbi:MAG: hypothetical protein WD717_00255 [Nitrosarchaeum sp.]
MEQNTERSIRIFLASLKSEKTRLEYIKSLEKFRKHFQIDSFNEYLKKDPKDIQLDLEDYLLWMRENVFTNSIPTYYHPIQTFLEMNDIMINFKKLRRLFPERAKTAIERGWTTEEIEGPPDPKFWLWGVLLVMIGLGFQLFGSIFEVVK